MERDLSLYPSTDAGIGCKNLASGVVFDEYLIPNKLILRFAIIADNNSPYDKKSGLHLN
jgi:hypothetical protein